MAGRSAREDAAGYFWRKPFRRMLQGSEFMNDETLSELIEVWKVLEMLNIR